MKKKIAILGSTGSIGIQTLQVIEAAQDQFELIAIAAGYNLALVKQQIAKFHPKMVSVSTEALAREVRASFPSVDVFWGAKGLIEIATAQNADLVVSALVGARGIEPTLAAINARKDIALANKEVLVAAGGGVIEAVKRQGVQLLPIDSEHNAIFQIMRHAIKEDDQSRTVIRKITLTASGGPFLRRPAETFSEISVQEALKHPRWEMGKRISIDSATLMNKGFEVIEAYWLFGLSPHQIEVVVHPQSIVHGLVTYCDGNTLACLSVPDMKAPLAYALSCSRGDFSRIRTEVSPLDLTKVKELTFEEPDAEKFPLLKMAFNALKQSGVYPCLLNAADEVAVEAFLENQISFPQISMVVEKTLSAYKDSWDSSLEGILEADQWARREAKNMINLLS